MGWSRRKVEGFLLAATAADDDGARTARSALAQGPAATVASAWEDLRGLEAAARREAIERFAAALRDVPRTDADLPPRARALLARDVPREVGSLWMRAAPRPRRGWAAPPALRSVLRRASRHGRADDPETADRERGFGREVVARALATLDHEARAQCLGSLGPAEAGAVLSLEPLLGAPGDGEQRRAALAVEALGALPALSPGERVRAAGAMALAMGGDEGEGDRSSAPWRRAGREMAELMGAGCRA